MSKFADTFILSMNHKLTESDLEMLDKIYEKYTPWELKGKILYEDMETILSYLILGRLPFSIGQGLITTNGKLFSKLVVFGQDEKLVPSYSKQPCILAEIEKLNAVLYGC